MDALKFHHDVRVEKANAVLRYRRIQRLTALVRYVEVLVLMVLLSRFSGQFAFSLNLSAEHLKETAAALISPRFVFLVGNTIVIALFFISGGFSPQNGEKSQDLYEQYVENCRKNQTIKSDAYRFSRGERKVKRCNSQNLERITYTRDEFPRRALKRTNSEKPQRKETDNRSKETAVTAYAEDEMSNEEFRRTVEAFIARQQRSLREEEEIPS